MTVEVQHIYNFPEARFLNLNSRIRLPRIIRPQSDPATSTGFLNLFVAGSDCGRIIRGYAGYKYHFAQLYMN